MAVPPGIVNKVTTTLLAKVPFSTSTVTLILPASSRIEYVAGLNPIVTTGMGKENNLNSELQYMLHTKQNCRYLVGVTHCLCHLQE